MEESHRGLDPAQSCVQSGPLPVAQLRIAALLLACVGTAVCILGARFVRPPLVSVGEIGPGMNLAYVRVSGTVVRGPDYYPGGPSLYFTLADADEPLRVAVSGDDLRALAAARCIPAVGDRVTVTGVLRLNGEQARLYLRDPAMLEVSRPVPQAMNIAEIGPEMAGQRVAVRGWIRDIRRPFPDLTLVLLRAEEGEIDIVINRSVLSLTGALPPLQRAQTLTVTGTVSLYRGEPQIVPASAADVVPAPQVLPAMSPGALSAEHAGHWVLVEGVVVQVHPGDRGHRFVLGEEKSAATLTLFLREPLWRRMAHSQTLDVGARLRVQGWLTHSAEGLELVPEQNEDLVLLVGAPAPPVVHGMEVGWQSLGKAFCLEGIVRGTESFPKGTLVRLLDRHAEIQIWVPGSIPVRSIRLQPGVRLRACGWVSAHRGKLEIVVRRPSDLQVLPIRSRRGAH